MTIKTKTKRISTTFVTLIVAVAITGLAAPVSALATNEQMSAVVSRQKSVDGANASATGSCSIPNSLAAEELDDGGVGTEMTLVESHEAENLTSAVYQAIADGDVSVQAPLSALLRGQGKVYSVQSSGTTFQSVTLALGGSYSMTSNITVLYSQDGEMLQYSETLVSENDLGNFNITSYIDGKFVNSNDTDLTFMSDDQLLQEVNTIPGEQVAARSIGSTVACVAATLGVTGGVAYLIVGACAGACAVPGVGTAVCVACIAAYAAVGGASITAVASCFG